MKKQSNVKYKCRHRLEFFSEPYEGLRIEGIAANVARRYCEIVGVELCVLPRKHALFAEFPESRDLLFIATVDRACNFKTCYELFYKKYLCKNKRQSRMPYYHEVPDYDIL